MEIKPGTATFRASTAASPPHTLGRERIDVELVNPANVVTAILTGMNVRFTPANRLPNDAGEGNDRWLGQLKVQLLTEHMPGSMNLIVVVDYLLRDWSGDVDDKYEGEINFVVVAI